MAKRGRPRKNPLPTEQNEAINKFTYSENNQIANPEIQEAVQQVIDPNYVAKFADRYYKTLDKIVSKAQGYYNPIYANSIYKDVNLSAKRPRQLDLKKWLESPQQHEKELRDTSQFLENVVMQYFRSVMHFVTLLSFKYDLLDYTMPPPKNSEDYKTYLNSRNRCYDWLKKFRPKEQFFNVMVGVIAEGGKYYYLRESDRYLDLQEMPQDYCYINGRVSIGWTYAMDMTFFSKFNNNSTLGYAPEFEMWYQEFVEEWQNGKMKTIYKPMPPEKAVIFKFDDTNAMIKPPLSGTFKDALEIQDYKDLLKLKLELDTWMIIAQEVPKDKDGKPTIDPMLAADYVAIVQATLPQGAKTFATALRPEAIRMGQSQNMNQIVGQGETNYWSSAGIAGNQFGMDSKSGIALKYSNQVDFNFVSHMYRQFERFINFHLDLISGQYKFGVKFYGCSLFEDEEKKEALAFAQSGGFKQRVFTSMGYEPFEIENTLRYEVLSSDINDLLIPIATSFTQSGKDGGRPTKSDGELDDSGLATRDGGYNEE